MSERMNLEMALQRSPDWEARFVISSATLLSGLAVADRLVAWLIGQFPTSSVLWHIRFEYLRPIAIYHDLVEFNLGSWSPWTFSMLVIAAWALIVAGALSRVRLARAVSCHLLFGAAVSLVVLCFDQGFSIQPRAVIGTPSEPYSLLGALLALIAAGLCLRVHAEYMGWHPELSRATRRLMYSIRKTRLKLEVAIADVLASYTPASGAARAEMALLRAGRQPKRSGRFTQRR